MDGISKNSRSSRSTRSESSEASKPERTTSSPESFEPSHPRHARLHGTSSFEGGSSVHTLRAEAPAASKPPLTSAQQGRTVEAAHKLDVVSAAMGLHTPVDKAVELKLLHNLLDPKAPPLATDPVSLKNFVIQEAETRAASFGSHAPPHLHMLVEDLKAAGSSASAIQKVFDEYGLNIRNPEQVANGTVPPRPALSAKAELQNLELQQAHLGSSFPMDRRVRMDYLHDTQGKMGTDTKSVATYLQRSAELQLAKDGSLHAPPHLQAMVEDLQAVIAGKAKLSDVLSTYGMEDPRP